MTLSNKIMLAIIAAAIVTTVIVYAKITAELYRKDAEILRLEMLLADCGRREESAAAMIAKQNAAVEAVRVDTVYVERIIKEAEKKYAEVRKEILLTVEKDSGCENKVDNIDYALRRFHGVGVRPAANGDKD